MCSAVGTNSLCDGSTCDTTILGANAATYCDVFAAKRTIWSQFCSEECSGSFQLDLRSPNPKLFVEEVQLFTQRKMTPDIRNAFLVQLGLAKCSVKLLVNA